MGIGCHPDDLELSCGGTLARYAARGDAVFMVVATDGRMGSVDLPPEQIAAVRHREALAAAEVIGAKLIWLGFPDQGFFDCMETRLAMIDAIRSVNPDVILTHYFPDYFSADHHNVGFTANAVSFQVVMPNIKTAHPHMSHNPPVYFFDSGAGIGRNDAEYVDITDQIETKRRMVGMHQSQEAWLKYHVGMEKDASMSDHGEISSRYRGSLVGVSHAEGFIRCNAQARNVIGTLLPV
jgi:LmbE family N-acetylglucosaminyl deacetylase